MDRDDARARFASGRVARLAMIGPRRQPQLLPVTFAMGSGPQGDAIACALDDARSTAGLRRLHQLAAQPSVSLLVDHHEDDASHRWWVRAEGEARVLDGGPTFSVAQAGLSAKYAAYALTPPEGPFVVVDVKTWDFWEPSDGAQPG